MRLYIDKENLISLMKSTAQDSFEDCAGAVRKELDVLYNFSKEDIKSNETLSIWFSRFGQGVKGKQEFVAEPEPKVYPPRPLKSNFYKSDTPQSLTSIYLLNDEHICDLVQNKSCVLVGKVGEETRVLSSLIIEDSETSASKISSWKDYCPNLPLTDIIICDNYYFKNKYTYEKNDNEIIRALANIPNCSPLNVIIITNKNEVDKQIDLSKEQVNIKEIVKKATNSKKSTVTILTTYRTHSRDVITNYYRIKHGTGFHLKDNGIKENDTTEVKTHLKRNNEAVTKGLLAVYQKVVNSPVECYGDRVCNLLSFS